MDFDARTFKEPLTRDSAGFLKLSAQEKLVRSASVCCQVLRAGRRTQVHACGRGLTPRAYRGLCELRTPRRGPRREVTFAGKELCWGSWGPGEAGARVGPRATARVWQGAQPKGHAEGKASGANGGHAAGILYLATRAPQLLSRLGEKPALERRQGAQS